MPSDRPLRPTGFRTGSGQAVSIRTHTCHHFKVSWGVPSPPEQPQLGLEWKTRRVKQKELILAIFYPFSQFCEIDVSLPSLQNQPKTAPNLFQRGQNMASMELVRSSVFGGIWTTRNANIKHTVNSFIPNQSRPDVNNYVSINNDVMFSIVNCMGGLPPSLHCPAPRDLIHIYIYIYIYMCLTCYMFLYYDQVIIRITISLSLSLYIYIYI